MIDLSSVDVFDLLYRMNVVGVRSASGGAEANFSCPFPGHTHGDDRPSAYMNMETTLWMCQGCKRKGTAISFVAELQGISASDAQRWLRDTYGIEFDEPDGGSMVAEIDARFAPVRRPDPPRRPSESWLSSVRFDWSHEPHGDPQHYMLDRGFSNDVLVDWDVGYDYDSDRLTIPVRDVDGRLIGVKARDWTGARQPKYLILGDRGHPRYGFEPYESKAVVFGLDRRREARSVVLLEGELNALACDQVGIARPVASGMSYLSPAQVELLVAEAEEFVVFWDPDEAGQIGTERVVRQLEPRARVRVVQGHDSDPAEMLRRGEGHRIKEFVETAVSSLLLQYVS